MMTASAFVGGWAAHGVYAKSPQIVVGSIEAKLLNAPVVMAETALQFAKSATHWAIYVAERATDCVEILQKIFCSCAYA